MVNQETIKFYKYPAIISIIFLLISFLDWPYSYYTFMKFIVSGSVTYYAYYINNQQQKQDFYFWVLVFIVILFNPIAPIYLRSKPLWEFIDIIVIIFLTSLLIKLQKNEYFKKNKKQIY